MNWQGALLNPQNKIVRSQTNFYGRYLNIYPWSVASVVTRIRTVGPTPAGSVVLGPTNSLYYQSGVVEYPVTVSMLTVSGGASYGDGAQGVYVIDPSNVGQLNIDFGASLGTGSVFIEGYTSDVKFNALNDYTVSQWGQLEPRAVPSYNSRWLTGTTAAISTAVDKTYGVMFRPNSQGGSFYNAASVATMDGTKSLYIGSNRKFSNVQFNLGAEDYSKANIYTINYSSGVGAFSTLASAIFTTTASNSQTALVFNQSGTLSFTPPAGWAPTTVPGDPLLTYTNNITNGAMAPGFAPGQGSVYKPTNFVPTPNQYWLRLDPPGGATETFNIISISLSN